MDHFREAHILPFLKIIGLDGEEESNELENEESWWVLKVVTANQDLREESEEVAYEGIQSLALGVLDHSFLVGDSGVQVKNFANGIHGKGVYVSFDHGNPKSSLYLKPHTTGLHQLDIETRKIVTEWKFGKDGADISMRYIRNDNKGSQLEPIRNRIFMTIGFAGGYNRPKWDGHHQFSRGTNFRCFASPRNGSTAVGSLNGKIQFYSTNSMRQARTTFPDLGFPRTHVYVTFDGKYLDQLDRAPSLLKLTPLDSHLAGANNKFKNAQLSWVTKNRKQEHHLVGTVGKFSVIRNFQQFAVTDSHEAPLVVATPLKVRSFSISSRQLFVPLPLFPNL
ncbi:protein CYPRO4-like [Gossypium hirsutum]|uniref:Protein CYPRO4-like n=1 Tax=Gossypium hirsutum TaxID=3635 RepID=A0ABM2ZHZ7_GOSHI|nr:protein CYPRO4-like [Gossypium hirsutum]